MERCLRCNTQSTRECKRVKLYSSAFKETGKEEMQDSQIVEVDKGMKENYEPGSSRNLSKKVIWIN